MFHDFYQNLPLHIDPIAFSIGFFSVRWYAISYIVGFGVVYLILAWRIRNYELKITAQIFNLQFTPRRDKPEAKIYNKNFKFQISNLLMDYLLVAFFSALVGGRIGYVLIYNFSYFFSHPLSIISPYNQEGSLVGIFGMSYHGALLGILIGSLIFLRKKKISFFAWADFIVPAVTLGYFFGRIGNFLNGELYGRITNSFLGMHFASDQVHLRHPSQLYEAVLEGLLLFVILWKMRKMKLKTGSLFGIYLIGYGALRTLSEQFRQPDVQIGFLFGCFTMGQLLSIAMIVAGMFILILIKRK